jgi:hypothetical protein
MADNDSKAFEQVIVGHPGSIVHIRLTSDTGLPVSQDWQYLGVDTHGVLVKETDSSSPKTYFFPWHTIMYIR